MPRNGENGTSASPRSTRKEQGDWGEQVAAEYLLAQGCAIVKRKWRGPGYEIDIIAQKGTRVIFVEVKTRSNDDVDPVSAVNDNKRRRMIRAADSFMRTLTLPLDYQFDIIAIVGTQRDYTIEHIPDAFFPSPRTRGNV